MSSTATSIASSQPPAAVTPKKGRRAGARGWKEPELEAMLDHIEEVMPCGTKQWEIVSLKLFESGYSRSAVSLRKKFDKLWGQEKPTGSAEIPRLVLRAQVAKEKISAHEVIGYTNENDTDEDDEEGHVSGTNLADQNGELRRPTPKKRKAAQMSEAVLSLGEGNKEAANTLADAMKEIASKLGNSSSDLEARVVKLESMNDKLDKILSKLE